MNTASSKWKPIHADLSEAEQVRGPASGYIENVVYQFSRRKTSVASFYFVAALLFIALIGPHLTAHSYDEQNLAHVNMPPFLRTKQVDDRSYYITSSLKLVEVLPDGSLGEAMPRIRDDESNKRYIYDADGVTYYLNYRNLPPTLEEEDGNLLPDGKTYFNTTYPLGSDGLGRDILTRLLYGARISLTVAFVATLVSLLIGVTYGSIAGYLGGNWDLVMMRIVDIISSIPLTLYVILIMVLFNNAGLASIIIALGIVYWVDMARVVRSQILSLREREFVLAARTMGSKSSFILFKHLIPNAVGPITVTATMLIPSAIFTESFMSFIGLGVTAPMASWGTMCNDALETLRSAPYQLAFPAAAICLTMFAFNFIGDGLRDAFDPHMRK